MDGGKLDEELLRISRIVDEIEPDALLLFNESFASTTEEEGSTLAEEVVQAFVGLGARVFFVTHLFHYSKNLEASTRGDVRLLRAERREDGTRSYKIREGIALPTSYGLDLYERWIGAG